MAASIAPYSSSKASLCGRRASEALCRASPPLPRSPISAGGRRRLGRRIASSVAPSERRVPSKRGVLCRASGSTNGSAVPVSAAGRVVVIDNYDSFTYNLCQYLGDLGCKYLVFKNDEYTVEEIRAMDPAGIMVSPGPGRPEDSGISLEIIEKLGPIGVPVFGVCMGHQCIGQVFGGAVIRAPCGVMHGKSSLVSHTDVGLLQGLPNPFKAARYHSLVIDKDTCPEDIEVTGWTEDGTIMACRHKKYPLVQGVQFHPESIITENGMTIVANFVKTLKQPAAV